MNIVEQKSKVTIAVSGDAGSFSEEAALQYAGQEELEVEIIYVIDMEGVLAAVEEGRCDVGIFPVVNSSAGLVRQAFEAMGRHRFTFVGDFTFDVKQCLLMRKEIPRESIARIVSHPQALAQCGQYCAREFPHVPLQQWADTAKAARDLSMGILDPTTAVIAPVRCAELYNLAILQSGIQDAQPNVTTFVIVTR